MGKQFSQEQAAQLVYGTRRLVAETSSEPAKNGENVK
jgi:hypothetical protein